MGERMLAGLRKAVAGYEQHRRRRARQRLADGASNSADDETGFEFGKRMLDRGVLVSGTLVNARVIRVEPPLTITEEQADYVCQARQPNRSRAVVKTGSDIMATVDVKPHSATARRRNAAQPPAQRRRRS